MLQRVSGDLRLHSRCFAIRVDDAFTTDEGGELRLHAPSTAQVKASRSAPAASSAASACKSVASDARPALPPMPRAFPAPKTQNAHLKSGQFGPVVTLERLRSPTESRMKPKSRPATELPIRCFKRQRDWAAWLSKNHKSSPGVWLQLAKKGARAQSVSYDEAVDVALCFGWIDGQKQAHDDQFWLQKFTRRSEKSVWSKRNRDKALTLVKTKKMALAGLREIERAKRDGRWDAAYDSSSKATVPGDFQAALDGNARAKAFFGTLDSRNRYSVLFRIQTAKKAETRAKRISHFILMLERHEKVHP